MRGGQTELVAKAGSDTVYDVSIWFKEDEDDIMYGDLGDA
jgi:hypothetical protein